MSPRWLVEGLGTMFEAPGVWDWRNHNQLSERINRGRLADFRQWRSHGRPAGALVHLLGSDRLFESNPSAAYAEAWAWALFLTETFPQKFGEYVQKVANRPNFEAYPSARRMSDFTSVFGDDLRRLDKHFLAFIDKLP